MAVYQPKYRDKKTGEKKTAKVWRYDFTYGKERMRGSTKTIQKTLAIEFEKRLKLELELAYAGLPVEASMHLNTVLDCTEAYRLAYKQGEKSKTWVAERLVHIEKALGNVRLPDLTEDRVREYMEARRAEGAGPRTVNMEVSILARAIGQPWHLRWPKLRHYEEPKGTGRALTPDEEDRLLKAAANFRGSRVLEPFLRVMLLTGMHHGKLTNMRWGQVDFENRILTVVKANTDAGTGRYIRMNDDLYAVLKGHAEWMRTGLENLHNAGHDVEPSLLPEYYLFPTWTGYPTTPMASFKKDWGKVQRRAGVKCRLYDLRPSVQ